MSAKFFRVALWEYLEKIRSKAFIISLFLLPIIMIGMGIVPGLLISRPDTTTRVIGVIDESGAFAGKLANEMENRYRLPDGSPNYIIREIVPESQLSGNDPRSLADSLVANGIIEGYIVIGASIMSDSSVEYRSLNVGNLRLTERLTRTLRDVVMERKLRSQGLDPTLIRSLTSPIELKTVKLSTSGKEEEGGFERVFLTSYVFIMMILIMVMTSGQLLVRSMLEEKSNRVVEILMSSCSASEIITGKILGLSGLGLTQLGIWGFIGAVISLKFGILHIDPLHAGLLLLYFVLGYLFYAGIFVAAGAPVSTEQEAQQITTYFTLILVLPLVLALPMMEDPTSTIVRVLSFVPLLTPTMMALRIPVQMPSSLEIAGTLMVLAVSALGTMWVASKVFRTTILMYGKRPSVKEMYRMLRSP
jgi:ABC-2 type transport system permease protein